MWDENFKLTKCLNEKPVLITCVIETCDVNLRSIDMKICAHV